ncbi:MAG: OB-fold nucleic acid binding domain-containing protein, partial [Bacteroidia bacterium]
MIKYCNQKKGNDERNQASLFEESEELEIREPELPQTEPWDIMTKLSKEKEVVGFFISGHPLDPYKLVLTHQCNANCSELKANLENFKNKDVTFGGIVTNFEHRKTKNGSPFGKLTIEDYHGTYDIMLFRDDYVKFSNFMLQNIFVYIKARVQERYNQAGIYELKVMKIDLLENVKENAFKNLKIKLEINDLTNQLIEELENLFNGHDGKCLVEFIVEDKNENMNVKLYSKSSRVKIDDELINALNKQNLEYELN